MAKNQRTELFNAEIHYPYCDWNALREVDFHIRHAVATQDILPNNPQYDTIVAAGIDPETHIPQFEIARWCAVRRFADYVNENKIKTAELADWFDVDVSLIHRMRYGQRVIMFPPNVYEKLCYEKMNISAHNFLFGEECGYRLPRLLSVIFSQLQLKDKRTINNLNSLAKSIYDNYVQTLEINPTDAKMHHVLSASDLLRRRLSWKISEEFLPNHRLMGRESTPQMMHVALYRFIRLQIASEIKLSGYMQMALSLECPADFLMCEHFTERVKCYIVDAGKELLITNKDLLKLLDYIMILDEVNRDILIGACWESIFEDVAD